MALCCLTYQKVACPEQTAQILAGRKRKRVSIYVRDAARINDYFFTGDDAGVNAAEKAMTSEVIRIYCDKYYALSRNPERSAEFADFAAFNRRFSDSYRYLIAAYLVVATTSDAPYHRECWRRLSGKPFRDFQNDVLSFWARIDYVPIPVSELGAA